MFYKGKSAEVTLVKTDVGYTMMCFLITFIFSFDKGMPYGPTGFLKGQ